MNLSKVLFTLGITLLLAVIVLTALPVSISYATGESMEPEISRGDGVLVIHSDTSPRVGDIIQFYAPEVGRTVTHRVVDVTESGTYITKGDNVPTTDQDGPFRPVTETQIDGTIMEFLGSPVTISNLGYVVPFVTDNKVVIVSLLLIFVVALGASNAQNTRSAKTKSRAAFAIPIGIAFIIALVAIILLQGATVSYSMIYTDVPNERNNTVPVGQPGIAEATIALQDDIASYSMIRASGDIRVQKTSSNQDSIQVRVIGPKRETTGAVSGTIAVYSYPSVLPYSVVATLHSVHPVLAATVISFVLSLIVQVLFVILYDPQEPVRVSTARDTR